MRCPVCRAENAQESACRRCRADLSLLRTVEEARQAELARAACAATACDGAATLRHAEAAHHLRPDHDTWRWLAVGYLLQRDFAQALAHHQRAVDET